MTRRLVPFIVLVLVAAPVLGQTDKALEVVPHDALGFILIKDLQQLSEKVDELATKLKVEERQSLLELIRSEMDVRDGLNAKGSALILAMKGKKDKPFGNPIVALPMSDREKMLAGLGVKDAKERIAKGEVGSRSGLLFSIGGAASDGKSKRFPVLVATKGDFVLLANQEDRDALERILDAKQTVAASVKPAREWLDAQDICGVVTKPGVQFGIGMFLAGPEGPAGSTTPGQFAGAKDYFAELEKNVQVIAFGSRIEKEGHARLLTRVYFEPGGSYAKWIAKSPTLSPDLLARMPGQQYLGVALLRLSQQTNLDNVKPFFPAKMPADEADRLAKELGKHCQRVSEVGVLVYRAKPADQKQAPDKELDLQGAVLMHVDDAGAFLDDTVQIMLKTRLALQKYADDKTEIKTEQTRVLDKPSWLVTVRTPAKDEKKDGKAAQAWEETFLLTALYAKTVLATTVSKDEKPEEVVTRYANMPKDVLSANRGLLDTRALLPKELQIAAYLSMSNVMKVKKETPPLAFALRALPAGVEAQFLVPYPSLQAMFESIKKEGKQIKK